MVDYPYRALPPIQSHVAPLYTVWHAGLKLMLVGGTPKIPEIVRQFCEGGEDHDPQQPERAEGIRSQLKLVAEIWEMITTSWS